MIDVSGMIENGGLESFPLTSTQMAYMMGRSEEQAFGGVATHAYYEITTQIDANNIETAFNKIIKNQQMLKTVICDDGMQYILNEVPHYEVEVDDYTGLSDCEQNQKILKQRERMAQQVFPLNTWPMYELRMAKKNNGKYYMYVSIDLLIADGMSIMILFDELVNCCLDNKEAFSNEVNFKDYVELLSEEKKNRRYLKNQEYFDNKIPDIPLAPDIQNKSDKITFSPHFSRKEFYLTPEEWISFQKNAELHNCSPTIVIACVYAFVLAHYCSQEDFSINFTATDRTHMKAKNINKMIGDFTTIMLVEINRGMFDSDDFWDCVKNVKKSFVGSYRRMPYDGMKLIGQVAQYNEMRNNAVMPYVFTGLLFKDNIMANAARIGKSEYRCSQTPQVFIDCQVIELNDQLALSWDYVEKIFDPDMIDDMFNELGYIIKSLAYNKNKIKETINLKDKQIELITNYNNTFAAYPDNMNLLKLMSKNLKHGGSKIAVKDNIVSLTYDELDRLSDIVAKNLSEQGVKYKDFIAVSASRCVETIVNIIGIIKCGAVYVPINPEYPQDRQEYIVKHSNCKDYLTELNVDVKSTDKIEFEDLSDTISGDSPAYVIYTSGSTGTPKGVLISHDAVCNTIVSVNARFNITPQDKIIGISSFCFDLSVYDIFGTLVAGATLRVANDARDIQNLADIVYHDNITVWNTVPAIMDLFCDEYNRKFKDEQKNSDSRNTLKTVMLSGDWIPLYLPERIKNLFNNVNVYSLGGATEASIWSIYYPVDKIDTEWNSIPYGYPLDNQQFYVLDNKMQQVPVGVIGELYIGGRGVAQSYINDKEKTGKAFINHSDFGRIYKTGDYGIMNKNGYIEFVGRKDGQVKVRGHRIELGEIENVICTHNDIENAVVTIKKDSKGRQIIVAYYVCNIELEKSELLDLTRSKLPDYMIPECFVKIDELPLTANGKVDRKALPNVQQDSEEEFVGASTETEKLMCEIFERILNTNVISVNEDFFRLGVDSIQAVRIVSVLREMGYEIAVKDIMYHSTIRDFAKFIDENIKNESSNRLDTNNSYKISDICMSTFQNNSQQTLNDIVIVGTEGKSYDDINKSFYKLIEHHSILRAVISDDVVTVNPLQKNLNYLDEVNVSSKELKEEENRYRYKDDNRLFKAEYVKTDETSCVIFCANKIIFDSTSWNIILEDFSSLLNDENCSLLNKTVDVTDVMNKISNSLNKSETVESPVSENAKSNKKVVYKKTERMLSVETTKQLLLEANSTFNTNARDIILAAASVSIGEIVNESRVNFCIPVLHRGTFGKMLISRTIGNLSPNVIVSFECDSNPENSIISVKETLRKLSEDGIILAKMQKESNLNSDIFFDDTGVIVAFSNDVIYSSFVPDGEKMYPYKYDMNICLDLHNDSIKICVIYNENKYNTELISELTDNLVDKINEFTEYCVLQEKEVSTLSDFTDEDMSLDELNMIMDMI